MKAMITIYPFLPTQWQLYKELRCAALADAPYAFSASLADALQRSDQQWQSLTKQRTTDPNGVLFYALDLERQTPCAMASCNVELGEAEMFAVWVSSHYRRQGVGKALLTFAEDWAHSQGATALKVGVFADNLTAVSFYLNNAFQDLGETKPELSNERRTVLLLRMNL